MAKDGEDNNNGENQEQKKKKTQPVARSAKRRKRRGPPAAVKIPQGTYIYLYIIIIHVAVVFPTSKCKLRLLKLERIKDFLLMEEEFIRNQELLRPREEQNEVNSPLSLYKTNRIARASVRKWRIYVALLSLSVHSRRSLMTTMPSSPPPWDQNTTLLLCPS